MYLMLWRWLSVKLCVLQEEAAEDGPHKSKSKEKSKNKDKTRDKYPWQPCIKHFL